MDNIKARFTGIKEIDAVLKGLPLQVNHKVLQNAHASAVKITTDYAKLIAPEGPTGHTIDSIGVLKSNFSKASELGLVEGGPRRGKYKGNKAHFTEHGTKVRYNKSGAARGSVKAKHWMERSWNATKDRVLSSVNLNIGISLMRFMRRTIKNG
jgi:hypothetical protein